MSRSKAVVAALVALTACNRLDLKPCAVTCADGVTCPSGFTCTADHHCHAAGDTTQCGISPDAAIDSTPDTPDAPPPSRFTAISAGGSHTCAIDADGALWCWGHNDDFQLGFLDVDRTGTPTKVSSPGWTQITANNGHTCGLRDGSPWCWGLNDYGQAGQKLGDPFFVKAPAQVLGGGTDWFAITTGDGHSCGLRGALPAGGRLYCWGQDLYDQLGDGAGDQSGGSPREIGATDGVDRFADFVAVSARGRHTCALRKNGDAYCFGTGDLGQLGNGDQKNRALPALVAGGHVFRAIAAGDQFTCALDGSGGLWCWGENDYGELGRTPGQTPAKTPEQVGALTGWSGLAAGTHTACALRGAAAQCWGAGDLGEIGNGTWQGVDHPTAISGLAAVDELTLGGEHVCARAGGDAWCWGKDDDGQLGTGTFARKYVPTKVAGGFTDWQDVVTATDHTCGLRAGGRLYCWGWNERHELGVAIDEGSPVPVEVTAATAWQAVALGDRHTCAIRQGASATELWCWGDNSFRQIGNGQVSDGPFDPAEIDHADASWSHLAASPVGACAVSKSGRRCWGDGSNGVLGDNTVNAVNTPTAIAGETITWTGFGFGQEFGCGTSATDLYCWGANDVGQQGRGNHTGGPFLLPVVTATGAWTVSPAFGGRAACGISGGALKCWGENGAGALGIGGMAEADAPTSVMSQVASWDRVATGQHHACAITAGALYCWGLNNEGELGNPDLGYSVDTPQRIAMDKTWARVAAGRQTTCAITSAGELYCWGANVHGLLGDGTRSEAKPVRVVTP